MLITRRWAFPALAALASVASADSSDKRGLCFVPNKKHPDDNKIWVQPGSDLTWYYNYGALPSPAFSDVSQDEFEYIPMMWTIGSSPNDTTFLDQVSDMIDSGRDIKHVLGFNEPNEISSYGGSNLDPKIAAEAWVANFEPLAEKGIKLGLPACSGAPSGMPWLKEFLGNCSEMVSTGDETKNCTWDFLPVHWYDNFGGLASHIGERVATWPNKTIWVTEYAFANQDLQTTEEYYNQTIDYFDKLDYIGRYSYFGAFRSKVSNVGKQATFLNNAGKLTNIGSLYLGFSETGVKPTSGSVMATPASTALSLATAGITTVMLLWWS